MRVTAKQCGGVMGRKRRANAQTLRQVRVGDKRTAKANEVSAAPCGHARPIGSSRIRILASPDYLARHGTPTEAAELQQHDLLGFNQPKLLNDWPLREMNGTPLHIKLAITSSSGETLRHMALAGLGIVCLSDFMTQEDRRRGRLVQVLARQTLNISQPINAVYYRNTALAARVACFVNYITKALGKQPFDE